MQIESYKVNTGESPTECDKCGSTDISNIGEIIFTCNDCGNIIVAQITFDSPKKLTMKKMR